MPSDSRRNVLRFSYVLTGIAALILLMSATMKLTRSPEVLQGFAAQGFAESAILPIAIVELLAVLFYLIPRTSVVGAVLITGYLGGAIATHVRLGEAFIVPLILALVAWGGIYFRDPRLRELLPFRK
jgi:MFS family permease